MANSTEIYQSVLFNSASLIHYYPLEGDSQDVWTGVTGCNGTDTNVTYGLAYGRFGQGATYTGATNSLTTLPNGTIPTGNTTKSLIAWFNTSDATARLRIIFGTGSVNAGVVSFVMYLNSAHKLQTDTGSSQNIIVTAGTVNDGLWHMAALTFKVGGAFTLYYDGAEVNHINGITMATEDQPGIGCLPVATSINFIGSIDDCAVFNKELSAAEVANIWNSATINYLKDFRGRG